MYARACKLHEIMRIYMCVISTFLAAIVDNYQQRPLQKNLSAKFQVGTHRSNVVYLKLSFESACYLSARRKPIARFGHAHTTNHSTH